MGGGKESPAMLPESVTTNRPRARDVGIQIGHLLSPGPLNSITDVPRIKVGFAQKFSGDVSSPDDEERKKIVRAGVTLIGTDDIDQVPLFAGVGVLQGSGELTGAHFIQECGQLTSHVAITGTSQVGSAYSGVMKLDPNLLKLPVVAETFDRMTHPLAPHPVTPADVREAFENMTDGKLREGNVGGGAAMVSFGLKGGTGTSSRLVPSANGKDFVVGAIVQANHGYPYDLTISGVPVGKILVDEGYIKPWFPSHDAKIPQPKDGDGSIIVVIATDAPLLPHQCSAVARRAGVGIARGGGGVGFFSGDIFLAFSTAAPLTPPQPPKYEQRLEPVSTYTVEAVSNETLDVIFRAASDATEEAVLNALFAAEELEGYTGRKWRSLPVERVKEILKDAGRI
ncbi:L-aminopeptidase/D-esterase [Mycena albidolilacea]|uniref:L-aminopeptidase/D-esterase n=1 Tax=Mycena albidolilacea TaxID=1033008 RepID=A0AAD7EP30_9AGAR|nr:L-aminopeptidase/D-esterase [Mycena albidolilacea]